MSTIQELVSRIHASGIQLALSPEGKLMASPPGSLPQEWAESLKRHKDEVKALLRGQQSPNYRTLYEEAATKISEDFPLLDRWLCDTHPALWKKIRDMDDELLRCEQQRVSEATYRARLDELITVCREVKALKEGRWKALVVSSKMLGTAVWVLKTEEAMALVSADRPIFFADEIPLLKGKPPEQLRDILKVKAVFPGCRVVQ